MDTNRDKRAPGLVRQTDIEPYTGLKWVSRLFKAASIFLFIALLGEFVAGLRYDGMRSLPVLLGESARTFVVAVVLWAGGDLVRLFVHLGHDIRAERVLLARLVSRMPEPPHGEPEPGVAAAAAPTEPAAGIDRESEGIPLQERGAAD